MPRFVSMLARVWFLTAILALIALGPAPAAGLRSCGPGSIGACPPWTPNQCDAMCDAMFGTPGNDCIGGCCICAM
jgi:hypothetical protein